MHKARKFSPILNQINAAQTLVNYFYFMFFDWQHCCMKPFIEWKEAFPLQVMKA